MKDKTTLAQRLNKGECGGGYGEAIIILSSAISAVAAEIWPGERIDRRRFVETMKNSCDANLHAVRVSVPLLVGHLRRSRLSEENVLHRRFLNFPSLQVLRGDDVDQVEDVIRSACPTLSRSDVREFSYSNVLYREVRSAFIHQYRSGPRADPCPLSESEDEISYGNWYGDPDRHIHFPVAWVSRVAESVAAAADSQAASFPFHEPTVWWIDEK